LAGSEAVTHLGKGGKIMLWDPLLPILLTKKKVKGANASQEFVSCSWGRGGKKIHPLWYILERKLNQWQGETGEKKKKTWKEGGRGCGGEAGNVQSNANGGVAAVKHSKAKGK